MKPNKEQSINKLETKNLLTKKTNQDFNGAAPNPNDPNLLEGSPKEITKAGEKLNKKNSK